MKKTIISVAALLAALTIISCQMPSNDYDNTFTGGLNTGNPSTTSGPAAEKPASEPAKIPSTPAETEQDQEDDESEEKILDLSSTRQYTMNVGETVTLPYELGEYEVWYQVETGNDVLEVSGTGLSALSVGNAVLKATDWNNENRTWSCSITVKADGFNGSAVEYKLGGNWTSEGGSTLVLNQNHTGIMKNYLNGSLVQDWVFSWTGSEYGNIKYLNITGCYDNKTNKGVEDRQFTVERLSSTSLTLKGNLGFGMPAITTWNKE